MSAQVIAIYDTGSLLAIEDTLQTLVDTIDTVTPEQEEQFKIDFSRALQSATDKRDRVAQFLIHLEDQVAFAGREISRLQARKQSCAKIRDRLEDYIRFVLESLGKDEKGKCRKLEGRVATFSLRACPPSIEIADETKVSDDFKSVSVSMPLGIWKQVLAAFPAEEMIGEELRIAEKSAATSTSKTAIKAALEAGCAVTGAAKAQPRFSLAVK